jgi:hypothetical protein
MRSQGDPRSPATLAISGVVVAAALTTGLGFGAVGAEPMSVPTTTVAPTTVVPTGSVPADATATTIPGPVPRPARRVATAIDTEKIRPTSLPFRALSVGVGVAIVCLAVAGFVYGKVRSRLPAVVMPKPTPAPPGPARQPPPTALPPPSPVSEWAPPGTSSSR